MGRLLLKCTYFGAIFSWCKKSGDTCWGMLFSLFHQVGVWVNGRLKRNHFRNTLVIRTDLSLNGILKIASGYVPGWWTDTYLGRTQV